MRRRAAAVMLVLVGCSVSAAQVSEQYSRCIDKANTQVAMHACANEEALRVDVELNEIYRELLSVAGKQSAAIEPAQHLVAGLRAPAFGGLRLEQFVHADVRSRGEAGAHGEGV